MQNSEGFQKRPHLSNRLDEARVRFRQIRQGLYKPFRKPEKFTVSYRPSTFENHPDLHTILRAPEESLSWTGSSSTVVGPVMDGSMEKKFGRSRSSAPVAAIFVHAGAGYHSTTNEHVHLGACKDAAKMAMQILKNGGTALDAVEAAVKVLEDKEITNAGYGSNLTIEGVVECDATVVDHLGRSGACGATAKIKNPINLARLILEHSNRPLSLRRVPPNLLVGEGAADFAWENGMPIVPHDAIVSKNARERFVRWREDLKRAGGAHTTHDTESNPDSTDDAELDLEFEERVRNKQRRDHTNAMLNGTWNEGQPDSPQPRSPMSKGLSDDFISGEAGEAQKTQDMPFLNPVSPQHESSLSPNNQSYVYGESPAKRLRIGASRTSESTTNRTHSLLGPGIQIQDGTKSPTEPGMLMEDLHPTVSRKHQREAHDGTESPTAPSGWALPPSSILSEENLRVVNMEGNKFENDEDIITDTVGAIAIDMNGHIAAASSSGGIGMKHRGRVGPAALVGVGTAVIPQDPHDPENVTVAAVTSGTGEHMATTMASQKCAERLYYSTRRGFRGTDLKSTDEEAMESFVVYDFMGHPGVKQSHSAGAIGVMAVKKTPQGYFFHFAHNTDSFALCSMSSKDKDAKCVMSRMGDHGAVVQGGRKIRID